MSRGIYTIILLALSNGFITLAWYGHLKFHEIKRFSKPGLVSVILISWGLPCLSTASRRRQIAWGIKTSAARFRLLN